MVKNLENVHQIASFPRRRESILLRDTITMLQGWIPPSRE